MTVAQAIVALQDKIGDELAASADVMGVITGISEEFATDLKFPYIILGPVEPLYDDQFMGEANGTCLREIRSTLWVYDNAPSRYRTLHAIQHIETVLDKELALSYGTAVGKPLVVVMRSECDNVSTLWRTPVEVRQTISGV